MDSVSAGEEEPPSSTGLPAARELVNLNQPPPFSKERPAELIEDGHGIEAINMARFACLSTPRSNSSGLDPDISLSSANGNITTQADSQALGSGGQHSENAAAYFLWPTSYKLQGSADSRTTFFNGLQKDVDTDTGERAPTGRQAATLLDVMTIRAYHSKRLRGVSLVTAVGFRTRQGNLTSIPAIIVFVARKVHNAWLKEGQCLPTYLEGPGGVWCDVDVVEFAYYGAPAVTPKEQVYSELVEGLRGNDPYIGPGSQVASHETYGTLGAIVQSRTGARQVGFLTNRHVAVDLDYPNQKMFHPLPPIAGPGVYLGAVERATSFITDDRWYSIFASLNPETFVRADGAFIPFGEGFDLSAVTTTVRGVGGMGEVELLGLQAPIGSIVGRQVVKVGRSSGLTRGSIMAYALEYNDEKGICFFTDFLIVGENKQAFDLEGDSGSLILMVEEGLKKPRPVGIILGGSAIRGRLKLTSGHGPEDWTSGVDLGRLLECLQLELITSDTALEEALERQRRLACGALHEDSAEDSHPLIFANPSPEVQTEGNQAILQMEGSLESFETGGKVYGEASASTHAGNFEGEPIDFMGERSCECQGASDQGISDRQGKEEPPVDLSDRQKTGTDGGFFDLNVSSTEEAEW